MSDNTNAENPAVDLWDSAHLDGSELWFIVVPESSLDDLFSEEFDMIKISNDGDGYWLAQDGVAGASRYDTVELAKIAGNMLYRDLEGAQAKTLLEDANLTPDEWDAIFKDDFRFVRKSDGAEIVADNLAKDGRQHWSAYKGDMTVAVDDAKSISEALSFLPKP